MSVKGCFRFSCIRRKHVNTPETPIANIPAIRRIFREHHHRKMTLLGSSLIMPILFTIFHISRPRPFVAGTDAENNVFLRRLRSFNPVRIVVRGFK
jgi:hypothetical protein